MLPKWHVIIGLLVAILLKATTSLDNVAIGIIFLSSFLIDFDHYMVYVFKKKDFDVDRAYEWFIEHQNEYYRLPLNERRKYKKTLMIFHGIEFWAILWILSYFSNIFHFMLIGIAVHMVADYIDLLSEHEPLYHKISQVYSVIKDRHKQEFYT